MISFVSTPSSVKNSLLIVRKKILFPSAIVLIRALVLSLFTRFGSSVVAPRGNIPSNKIFVSGDLLWIVATIFLIPAAMASGGCMSWPVLFVPIMITATRGLYPSNSP